jgi:hypothetical protein
MNNIIKINATEYGLEEVKAKQISDMFKPMLDKMEELENEYNEVVKLEISKETTLKAKELRLKYVKVRTGTAKIHKELKQFYLLGGRFVDGWRNAQLMASEGIEEKLSKIEQHYEILEAEEIVKIKEERELILSKYDAQVIPEDLGTMHKCVWDNYLIGAKEAHRLRKEAEKKAEEKRIVKEKAAREETERLIAANKKLTKEATEKDRLAAIHAQKIARENALLAKKEAEARKTREEKEQKEREAYEAKIQAEQEERERLIAKLKEKEDAEQKAKDERRHEIEIELVKGDAEKIKDFVNELDMLKTKCSFKSDAAIRALKDSNYYFVEIIKTMLSALNNIKGE